MNKVDPQRPSTWRPYKNGMCDDCTGGCCTLPVEVTLKDLIRLELTDEFEIENDFKGLLKRLQKERIVKSYYPPTKVFILETKNYSDCIFLDHNRRCTVYEKRPDTCRNFPKIGPKSNWCPYEKKN
jgi:Fe-S-cluster containining protein